MKSIPNKTLTIEQLEHFYQTISEKTDWDLSRKMVWGYFFSDHKKSKLEKARHILEKKGYQFAEIHKKNGLYWLQMNFVEMHTILSLDKKNDELYILADKLKLNSYDGMDVGPMSVHSI